MSFTRNPELWQFPMDFPLKIMGMLHDDFAQEIAELVQQHDPNFNVASLEMRPSSGNKYLSVTCTIRAVSHEQLDALYSALTAHPLVKVVL
jgi:uncharacterized protein